MQTAVLRKILLYRERGAKYHFLSGKGGSRFRTIIWSLEFSTAGINQMFKIFPVDNFVTLEF